ncbi:MAG: D-alanyl-D-alanine carboxypeptidase [Ruminococcaceae bacterium]|nr:D-alanyl-D-alanine carboxypeptidase [Oscillospiraceae bacterium]
MKKRCFAFLVVCLLLVRGVLPALATEEAKVYPYDFAFEAFWYEPSLSAVNFESSLPRKSCLLMEASTGKVLYADNQHERLPIASVTKVMATLLIMEALDGGKIALEDTVTVSERAASMGGSQVFLEPGEQMSVDDLLKSVIVVSANDATVALAEAIYGSEEAFIAAMNQKGKELGLKNTNFVNTNGLPAQGHYSSAYDVAVTTRELLKHPTVLNYTNIWMDTIRDGAFGLANTNKLVRFYKGANGMKTGFTSEAGYCLSGTALRDGMQLIAVVLGSPTSEDRFALAKQLLDFGFANYRIFTPEMDLPESLPVTCGVTDRVKLTAEPPALLLEKGASGELTQTLTLPETTEAPVKKGQQLGTVEFTQNGVSLAVIPVFAAEDAKRMDFLTMINRIFTNIFSFL